MLKTEDFQEHAAIALLRTSVEKMAACLRDKVYDLPELDESLPWVMFVGDINLFSWNDARAFSFSTTYCAKKLGYQSAQEVIDAGSFTIMARHYKKIDCVYWVPHLLRLPGNTEPRAIDYFARTKVLIRPEKLGFAEFRYVACNLPGYRTSHHIVSMAFPMDSLEQEACCLSVAVDPDPRIRARFEQMRKLVRGKRRLQVFLRRSRKQAPRRIAEALGVTEDSVNEQLTEIYKILGFQERKLEQLIEFAAQSGLKDSELFREPSESPVWKT